MISLQEKFQVFLARIQPLPIQLKRASVRVDRLCVRIEKDFVVKKSLVVGSHWKNTAVRRLSDVDLFVVMAREEAKRWSPQLNSLTLIGRVARSVKLTYPNNVVRRDQQAVTVNFDQGDFKIDIVPAIFDSFSEEFKCPMYLIPDGEGDWQLTCPEAQKKLLEEEHQRSGNKLKSLVRMMKWWGVSRGSTASISSLYVEHFIPSCNIRLDWTYQEALAEIFTELCEHKCRPIEDPLEISEKPFRIAKTRLQEVAILNAAKICRDRAYRALEFQEKGKNEHAYALWRSIFNGALI